jgi:hypothetical protein
MTGGFSRRAQIHEVRLAKNFRAYDPKVEFWTLDSFFRKPKIPVTILTASAEKPSPFQNLP